MAQGRKKFKKGVLIDLINRSGNRCECCGLDIIVDKHHVIEFSQGGPDEVSNILCVCPSCHRDLPEILTEEDQKYIQKLNFEKRSGTFFLASSNTEFEIGSTRYKGNDCMLAINDKQIIYPYSINNRIYANVIMLNGFQPYLLVIANRVICSTEEVSLNSTPTSIEVSHDNKQFLRIEKDSGKIKILIKFKFKGHIFDFNEKECVVPGNRVLRNIYFENCSTALHFNIF